MKLAAFSAVALFALVGVTLAIDFNNDWNDNFNNFNNNDDEGRWGIRGGMGSWGSGMGSWGSGMGSWGSGMSSWGSGIGHAMGYGSSFGHKVSYVPLPTQKKESSAGLTGIILPLLLLTLILPNILNTNTQG